MAIVRRSSSVVSPSLRILHVQHSLGAGGMENGVVNVAQSLTPRGFDFHVCCLSHRGEFADRMPRPENIHVLEKPDRFTFQAAVQLARLLRKVRPDVIHTHNIGALLYAALATCFGYSYPILHGEHHQPTEPSDIRSTFARIRRNGFYGAATRIHTVSHALREYFLHQGFAPDRVIALVNGVDTARFSPGEKADARALLRLPEGAPVVLVVGRLVASKRHALLFEAFEEVVRRWPKATLCVVGGGDGSDAAEINASAEASPVRAHIRMAGFQPDPLPYYRAADLLVAPSITEGLSNVVLEAMACGLPVLANDACGNRDVIESGESGIVADLTGPAALAGHLISLLENVSHLETLGQRARISVESRFGLASMADAYARTYGLVAGKTLSAPAGD